MAKARRPGYRRTRRNSRGASRSVARRRFTCYVTDEQITPLLALTAGEPALRVLHRPANLEDVFLKLTGRELRD